ncbi:MAG: hypothetical protein LBM98_06875 [Oscillospiraceae bacterium]|nr:hypothetical protein [Oscillospiraceae bacterium]
MPPSVEGGGTQCRGLFPVLIPSVEGCRPQAAGRFPAPCAVISQEVD